MIKPMWYQKPAPFDGAPDGAPRIPASIARPSEKNGACERGRR